MYTKVRFILILYLLFLYRNVYSQTYDQNKLAIEVKCYDPLYKVNHDPNQIRPIFILGIRNIGKEKISINQFMQFAHQNDTTYSNITYELYYVEPRDSFNVLNTVFSENIPGESNNNIITLKPMHAYFFEFSDLFDTYFKKSGRYKIRFTLLRKNAPEFMTENILTNWIYFDVEV